MTGKQHDLILELLTVFWGYDFEEHRNDYRGILRVMDKFEITRT